MSYILDALKKAEMERLGDSIPLAQQLVFSSQNKGPAPAKRAWGLGLLALAGLIAALVWFRPWRTTQIPSAAAPAPQPATAKTARTPSSAPLNPRIDDAPPLPRAAAIKPPPPDLPRESPKPESAADKPAGAPAEETPRKVRAAVPNFLITGVIYSKNAAESLLLIDREPYHQGDEVKPGLKLERIMTGEAIFNYRGKRYHVFF